MKSSHNNQQVCPFSDADGATRVSFKMIFRQTPIKSHE